MKSRDESVVEYVSATESDQVSRKLLGWLNQYDHFPVGIRSIDFEYLGEDKPCMALSTIQGAYKTVQYISGGYVAQYQFKLIYRAQPGNNGDRLKMDEVLDLMADMSTHRALEGGDPPDIGEGLIVTSLTCDTRAGLFGRYGNGDEDHQILMTMEYERK